MTIIHSMGIYLAFVKGKELAIAGGKDFMNVLDNACKYVREMEIK